MKLLIIDDHPMTCAGLQGLLQAHWREAEVRVLHDFHPDVAQQPWDHLFLDIHLPGQVFADVLAALGPRLPQVVLISAYPQPAAVALARQQGVCGVLPKNIDIQLIIDGFKRILQGERVFIGNDGQAMGDGSGSSGTAFGTPDGPALTARQHDTLQALMAGLSNKQIARKLGISEHTVKEHVTAILAAYGVRNRLELLLQRQPPADTLPQ